MHYQCSLPADNIRWVTQKHFPASNLMTRSNSRHNRERPAYGKEYPFRDPGIVGAYIFLLSQDGSRPQHSIDHRLLSHKR